MENLDEDLLKESVEAETDFDDTFDDSAVDEQFEDGDSLIGEKYDAPKKEEKFVDVHKGIVIDKKDVSPILQIKSFFEANNIKIRDPKGGCRKCYGRGYVGFEIKTQTYVPCGCLFPPQIRVEKEAEQYKMMLEGKMRNTPDAKRMIRRWEKQTRKKLIHQKVLDIFKNKDIVLSANSEMKQSLSAVKEVSNG